MNKKFAKLIMFFGITLPLTAAIPIIGTDVWYPQFLALGCILACFSALVLWQMNKWVSLFILYASLNSVVVANAHSRSIFCALYLNACALIAYGISRLHPQWHRRILRSLCWGALIQCVWVLIQILGIDPIFNNVKDVSKDAVVGFLGSKNQLGLYMSMMIAPCYFFMRPVVIAVAVALLVSKTSFAYVGAFSACIWMFLKVTTINIKRFAVLLILCLIGSLFINFDGWSEIKLKERCAVWTLSLEQVVEGKAVVEVNDNIKQYVTCNSLFGFGLGNFMKISPRTQKDVLYRANGDSVFQTREVAHRYEHAHNDYIEIFFDLGFIGIVLLGMIVLSFFKNALLDRNNKLVLISSASIIALMISAFGIYTVHTAVSGFLLTIFAGIFYGNIYDGKKRQSWQNS